MEENVETNYVIDDSYMLEYSLDSVDESAPENNQNAYLDEQEDYEECLIEEDVEEIDDQIEFLPENGWEPVDTIQGEPEHNDLTIGKENEFPSEQTEYTQDSFLTDEWIEEEQEGEEFVKEENGFNLNEEAAGSYFCNECHSIFDDLSLAENHSCEEIKQVKMEQLTCSDCDLVFKTALDLQVHTGEDHLTHPQFCDICSKSFLSIRGYFRHKLNDHKIREPFQCHNCHKIFKNMQILSNHVKNVCRITKKTSESPAKTVPVVCEICNTQISSAKSLKFHMRTHQARAKKSIEDVLPAEALNEYNELNQFYCEICNKSFDQNLLEIHKNMHQNLEEHLCNICNRKFKNALLYDMHMQLHASQADKQSRFPIRTEGSNGEKLKYPCQYCGRAFGKPYEKVKHERIHTGEKPYDCEVCGKSFRTSYSLTMHLRSHTDIRPHVCEVCRKRFKSKSAYNHHIRSHLDEKDYKCDMCPKTFRTSVRLNAHRNSHSKPFSCLVCEKRFATLHATKSHMRTHVKNKNDCDQCNLTFENSFALTLHMQEVHQIEVNLEDSNEINNLNGSEEFQIIQEINGNDIEVIEENEVQMNMDDYQMGEVIVHESEEQDGGEHHYLPIDSETQTATQFILLQQNNE